jgi:hypothetical protein
LGGGGGEGARTPLGSFAEPYSLSLSLLLLLSTVWVCSFFWLHSRVALVFFSFSFLSSLLPLPAFINFTFPAATFLFIGANNGPSPTKRPRENERLTWVHHSLTFIFPILLAEIICCCYRVLLLFSKKPPETESTE